MSNNNANSSSNNRLKLYYSVGSCSSAVLMLVHTLGIDIDCEAVDLHSHKTKVSNLDYYTINKKGNVPCLVFPDGRQIIETAALLQFFADQKPDSPLFAKVGEEARYGILNEVNFIATELHTTLGSLFGPADDAIKNWLVPRAEKKLAILENKLAASGGEFLSEKRLTIVDYYAFIIISWHKYVTPAIDISKHSKVAAYHAGLEKNATIADAWKFVTGAPTKTK